MTKFRNTLTHKSMNQYVIISYLIIYPQVKKTIKIQINFIEEVNNNRDLKV